MQTLFGLLLTTSFLGVFVCMAPAGAQVETREGIALQNQIAELRQELQTVQQNQQSGGLAPSNLGPPPGESAPQYQPSGPGGGGDTAAQLVVRVSALEEQNRTLQGRVDDLTNQVQHDHDDLAKQIGDLAFKLGQAPAGGSAPAAESFAEPTTQAAPVAVPKPVHRTPELALREGNAALARRDYPAAEAAAREALAGHSPRTTDAQFLLARAEAGQHDYKQAAADFYQAYNHAPRSPTAPIALLGVANTLIALNDDRDACQALAKLSVEFPGAQKAGVASSRKRASCGR